MFVLGLREVWLVSQARFSLVPTYLPTTPGDIRMEGNELEGGVGRQSRRYHDVCIPTMGSGGREVSSADQHLVNIDWQFGFLPASALACTGSDGFALRCAQPDGLVSKFVGSD